MDHTGTRPKSRILLFFCRNLESRNLSENFCIFLSALLRDVSCVGCFFLSLFLSFAAKPKSEKVEIGQAKVISCPRPKSGVINPLFVFSLSCDVFRCCFDEIILDEDFIDMSLQQLSLTAKMQLKQKELQDNEEALGIKSG